MKTFPPHRTLWPFVPFALLFMLSVSAGGCDRATSQKSDEAPSPPVSEVSPPQPVKKPSAPWYVGSWSGEVPLGKLALSVSPSAEVTGTWVSAEGVSQARGMVEIDTEMLRLRLVGPHYFGSLVAPHDSATWAGTLRASKLGTIDLTTEPPRFGEAIAIELRRNEK